MKASAAMSAPRKAQSLSSAAAFLKTIHESNHTSTTSPPVTAWNPRERSNSTQQAAAASITQGTFKAIKVHGCAA